MEGDAGGRRRAGQAVAVIVLLCCLAPSFTCFSLQGLRKKVKQDNGGNEVAAIDVKTGSTAFNGKVFNFQSGSASAAAPGNELLHVDLYRSDGTEMLELENDLSNEAEWSRFNPLLHCGLNKMKLKFMGLGAADLQLHMGDAPPLPLTQVPKMCRYSMQQNELGLDLVVPYNGCNVIQENGRHILQMRWQETPVEFACPMLPNPDSTPASTDPEPMQKLLKVPLSHKPSSLRRSKRDIALSHKVYSPSNKFMYCTGMCNQLTTPELATYNRYTYYQYPYYPHTHYYSTYPHTHYYPTYSHSSKYPTYPHTHYYPIYPNNHNYVVYPLQEMPPATAQPPTVKPVTTCTRTTRKCPTHSHTHNYPIYPNNYNYVIYPLQEMPPATTTAQPPTVRPVKTCTPTSAPHTTRKCPHKPTIVYSDQIRKDISYEKHPFDVIWYKK